MDAAAFFGDLYASYGGRYTELAPLGKGSYGVVVSALDRESGERVAIKKVTGLFENSSDATRILRETTLLRLLRHPNIVALRGVLLPADPAAFNDLFVVFEQMDTDLHQARARAGAAARPPVALRRRRRRRSPPLLLRSPPLHPPRPPLTHSFPDCALNPNMVQYGSN
jgi:hypothetical protein